ncbi:MAG TPA: SagB/ThcOx family dehydrogenase [Candidatus Bathyarchaeia archaeon]|nr:SagB/ThcOx family dehydrogenase [Candidatus Bathyarchaeia archaeon]
MKENRKFLQFFDTEEYKKEVPESDEEKKIPPPPFERPYTTDANLIDLVSPEDFKIGKTPFLSIVNTRKSRRKYTEEPLSLEELSFLLWCTQGLKRESKSGRGVFRTVPSSGAKSPFETYLVINRVDSLKPGLYRYISFKHKLLFIKEIKDAEKTVGELTFSQNFVGKAQVIFFWIAVPYRTEWRYTILAHKFIAIDLGLLSQSLYMACEAVKLGTCAIGYYEQNKLDKLFELETEDEFVVLVQPVGKYPKEKKITEFFKNPKAEVKLAALKKLLGTYKYEKSKLEIILEEGQLFAILGDYKERLDPYNETEFEGEYLKALRFIFAKDGKVEKLLALTSHDNIREFLYIESKKS